MSDDLSRITPCCNVQTTPDRYGTYICVCKRAYVSPDPLRKPLPVGKQKSTTPLPSAQAQGRVDEPPTQETDTMTDTDTSTEAVAAAPAAEPKHRASKGALEAQVREVTDAYSTGTLSEHPTDKRLTPLAIAKIIQARHGLDKMPSPGAVSANLDRWEAIGFAVMSDDKPRAFIGYTPEAASVGLSELKARSRVAKSEKRKAEKASAPAPEPTPAPAAEPVAAEPVNDIPVGTGL